MDRISLRGIRVWAHHGLLPHERERGQPFLIDATLELDLSAAAASDRLEDTVDYGGVAERLARTAAGQRCDLLEAVAGRLLDVLLDDPRVGAAEVTVTKPRAALTVPADGVAVTLRRRRPEGL